MSYCAPGVNGGGGSCLSLSDLRKIATAYNKSYPNNQIKAINNLNKGQLWMAIRNRLNRVCNDNEACWVEQNFILDPELESRFKPKQPGGRYSWLATDDIHNVMTQYEKVHKDFAFLGPVPINFSELSDSLVDGVNNLDLNRAYRQGIRKIAIVFNLSGWYPGQKNSGSHWVALWINLTKREIAYFDSYGLKGRPAKDQVHCIPEKINQLVERLIKNYPGFTIKCNTFQHQRDNSECGVYAMYFIKSALEGRSIDAIFRDIKRDEEMNLYRDEFFRPQNKNTPAWF